MGTTFDNTAEGGVDATVVTAGNSGGSSGHAIDFMNINAVNVTSGGDSHFVFRAASAFRGSMGYEFTPFGSASYARFDNSETAIKYNVRVTFKWTGTLTATTQLFSWYTAADGLLGYVGFRTAGQMAMFLGSTAQTTTNSTAVLTWGAWYTVEAWYQLESSVGAADGVLGYDLYDAAGATVHANKQVTGLSTGTTNVGRMRLSLPSNTIGTTKVEYDDIRYNALASGKIGGFANTPPTVSGAVTGGPVVSASTTATITFTAADTDGTVTGRSTAYQYPASGGPSLTGGTTGTVTLTTGTAPKLYQIIQTVTDNSSASTPSAPVELYVEGTGTIKTLPGLAGEVGSAWTLTGGGADEGTTLSDGSGTTLVTSPTITTTEVERRFRMEPMAPKVTPRIILRGAILSASVANINKVRVYADTTLITTRLTNTLKRLSDDVTQDVTTSSTDLYFDLTSGEVTAIAGVTNGRDKIRVALAVDLS